MELSRETYQEVLKQLVNHFRDSQQRKTVLEEALFGSPVLDKVDYQGDSRVFCGNLVTTLVKYGNTADNDLPTLVLLLDTIRGNMGGGPKADALEELIATVRVELGVDVPAVASPTVQPVDKTTPLDEIEAARVFTVNATKLYSVPLVRSVHCEAFVVGKAGYSVEDLLGRVKLAQLCLQFTRTTGDGFMSDVYRTIRAIDDPMNPFLAVQIVGPADANGKLLLTEPAHWADAVRTTERAIEALLPDSGMRLQVFALAPGALTLPIGRKFYRFWDLEMFNWTGDADVPYARVLDTRAL